MRQSLVYGLLSLMSEYLQFELIMPTMFCCVVLGSRLIEPFDVVETGVGFISIG